MPTRNIKINDVLVTISAPYAEGHQVNAREATALNQVRGENIANNVRTQVKAAIEEHGGPAAATEAVQAIVTAYDETYSLAQAPVTTRGLDPVTREARQIARDAIRDHLVSTGRKMSEFKEGEAKAKLDAEIARLSEDPAILKEAQAIVTRRSKSNAEVSL